MRQAWVLIALLVVPWMPSAQTTSVLRIEVTLPDPAGRPTPVPRHALLISDDPPTAEPRRVLTQPDGTAEVRLRPGSYVVESDRPIAFLGKAYQWTQMVDVPEGRRLTLALTAANAEVVPIASVASSPDTAPSGSDPSFLFTTWGNSVVAVWSPTARATGFVVDSRGLIATDAGAIGQAGSVEVQVSDTVKVPGRVLASNAGSPAAIVWVDPAVIAGRQPLPLACPPARAPSLDDGDEIVTITSPLRTPTDQTWGEVTTLSPRAIETDFRLGFGGAGGPVFDAAGDLVGLTALSGDAAASRRRDVVLVRAVSLCDVLSSARTAMTGASAPEATPLPTDPRAPISTPTLETLTRNAGQPPVVTSDDFEVALITPPMLYRAEQRADYSGGSGARSPEEEARLGRLTDFGALAEYFSDFPPVLVIRVTPRLVEGFWKRLAREAARTQGANLPPLKSFKANFLQLRASCGGAEIVPLHPFVLEHHVSEKDVVREGLYVFDPDAFQPQCGDVTLTLTADKAPDRGETVAVDRATLDRLRQDFPSSAPPAPRP